MFYRDATQQSFGQLQTACFLHELTVLTLPLSFLRSGLGASEHWLPGQSLHPALFPHSLEAMPFVIPVIRTHIHACLPEINVCDTSFSQGLSYFPKY